MFNSLLDNDLYKFTQQQAVWALFPDVKCTYKFINRKKTDKFNEEFLAQLKFEVLKLCQLGLTFEEREYLEKLPYFKEEYINWLSNFKFDGDELDIQLVDGDLDITINGLWKNTILWEVPLMAMISETFFKTVRKDWTYNGQPQKARDKALTLHNNRIQWADFGTRRRRSTRSQEGVVEEMNFYRNAGFLGTSNVYLAKEYDTTPIGTVAHEWFMAHSTLTSLRHANYYALKNWADFYQGQLGIALTDTYGTDAFFNDFNEYYSRLYDGLRWDSGDWGEFTIKALKHYEKNRISAKDKKIVYTDGLDVASAIKIQNTYEDLIQCSFGIGTHLTNDFDDPALNMVIKLNTVNDIPVVKLSDVPSKACGNPDAIRVAKWTFFNTPLDAKE